VKAGYSIHSTIEEYGIQLTPESPRKVSIGFIIGFLCITGVLLVELITMLIIPVEQLPTTMMDAILQLPLYGSLQVIVAVVEELTFRGFILQNSMSSNKTLGILWASVLFALSHMPTIWAITVITGTPFVLIFIMLGFLFSASIFLSFLVIKTKSLWVSIGFHLSWNFFQYYIYGLTGNGVLIFTPLPGYDIIHGGSLGPEAGLVALIIIICCILLGYYYIKKELNAKSTG
jgi:membrane protease YdiL (CAAX protease family)